MGIAWIFLFLSVVGISSISFFAKVGSAKGITPFCLASSLYTMGALLTFVPFISTGRWQAVSIPIVILGALCGAGGVFAFMFFTKALKIHYGLSVSLIPLSFVVPVVVAVFFWEESVGIYKIIGISLILCAILSISSSGRLSEKEVGDWPKWLLSMGGAFSLTCVPQITQAAAVRLGENNHWLFLFTAYISGAVLTYRGRIFNRITFLFGTMAALGSVMGNFFTLKSLELLSETVVFPVSFGVPVIVGSMLSRFLFGEKINRWGYAGIATGLLGTTILCIK